MLEQIVEFQKSGMGQVIAIACVFMLPLFWSIYLSAFVDSKEKPFLGHLFLPSIIISSVFASIDGLSIGKIIAGIFFWIVFMAFEFGFISLLIDDNA